MFPNRIRAGESTPITLRVTNPAAHAIDVYMRGRSPTFDVIIARDDGAIVWRRLQNEIIPAIALVQSFKPFEQLELSAQWNGRDNAGALVDPGKYSARGLLLVEGTPLETAPVPFIVGRP